MKKKNNLKNIFDSLVILSGTVSAVFFYLAKYKEIKIFQYLFFVSLLCLGIVSYIGESKFSEKTEMSSFHVLRAIGIIFISVLAVIFMILDPAGYFRE